MSDEISLYLSLPLSARHLHDGTFLCTASDATGTSTHILDRLSMMVLEQLHRPQGKQEIIASVRQVSGRCTSDVLSAFEQLFRLGLIRTPHHRTPTQKGVEPATISDLLCVTASRPDMLTNLYKSCFEYCERFERALILTIINDARSFSGDKECRLLVDTWPRGARLQIRYVGLADRIQHSEDLASMGIVPAIARYALLGIQERGLITTGSGANAALLGTIGRKCILIDDDLTLRVANHSKHAQILALCSDVSFRYPHFFSSQQQLRKAFPIGYDVDILSEHEKVLGLSLDTLLSDHPDIKYESSLSSRFRNQLVLGGDRHILLSHPGVTGAPGMYTGTFWLLHKGSWTSAIKRDLSQLESALANRVLQSAPATLTITDNAFCQAMGIGLANDHQLPPFMPIGRNQDGVFGHLLQTLFTGSIAHLPFAQEHIGAGIPEQVIYPDLRLADVIIGLIDMSTVSWDVTAKKSLRDIGRAMELVLGGPVANFGRVLMEFRNRRIASMSNGISQLLAERGPKSPLWERTMCDLNRTVLRSADVRESAIPSELRGRSTFDEAVVYAHQLAMQTAHLFQEWNDIRDASQQLIYEGRSLSKRI